MYPINVTTGEAGARSKGLGWAGAIFMVVKMLLALPHLIIVSILGRLAVIIAYIGFFFVAFTGALPGGLRDMVVAIMRWEVRAYAWVGALTDDYPPFEWEETDYVAKLSVEDPPQRSKGWAVSGIFLVKFLVLIPQLFVLAFVAVGAFFAMWFNFFKIAFTGESSPAVHDFLTGTIRWGSRVEGWTYGLTDEYPPFRLEP